MLHLVLHLCTHLTCNLPEVGSGVGELYAIE